MKVKRGRIREESYEQEKRGELREIEEVGKEGTAKRRKGEEMERGLRRRKGKEMERG